MLLFWISFLSLPTDSMSSSIPYVDSQNRVRPPYFSFYDRGVLLRETIRAPISNNTFYAIDGTLFYENYLSYSCQDDSSWVYVWPDSGSFNMNCHDYAPGGVNNAFCAYDVGLLGDGWSWTLAEDSCPLSCGECCKQFCIQNNFSSYDWTLNGIHVGGNFTIESCLSRCPSRYSTPINASFWMNPRFVADSIARFSSPGNNMYFAYIDFLQNQSGRLPVPASKGRMSGSLGIITDVCILDLMSNEPGTSVRFTTDGSIPTSMTGSIYRGGGITVQSSATIQAVAFRPPVGRGDLNFDNRSSERHHSNPHAKYQSDFMQ
jgi:hypothetical protein